MTSGKIVKDRGVGPRSGGSRQKAYINYSRKEVITMKEGTVRISLDLPASIKKEFHKLAIDRGLTQKELLLLLIKNELSNEERDNEDTSWDKQ